MYSKPMLAEPSMASNNNFKDNMGISMFPHKVWNVNPPKLQKYPDTKVNMDGKIDITVAYVGNTLSGKSTLIAVLTRGILDNGVGASRLAMFRHLHERKNGITTAISAATLGFNDKDEVLNQRKPALSLPELCLNATKLITMIDLPGSLRFMHTTLYGLTSYSPDYVAITINSVEGIVDATRQFLSLLLVLKRAFHIVITKRDLPTLVRVQQHLNFLFQITGCNREWKVATDGNLDALMVDNPLKTVPVFFISCVNGSGLYLYYRYLSKLTSNVSLTKKQILENQPCEFRINEVIVQTPTHSLVCGVLARGVLEERTSLIIGPFTRGEYYHTVIHSIHRHNVPCTNVRASQNATLSFGPLPEPLRKGLVLLNPNSNMKFTCYFEASFNFSSRERAIRHSFDMTVFIGNIRETAYIINTKGEREIQNSDTVIVKLARGYIQPQHIALGTPIFYRNRFATAHGIVKHISLNSFNRA